MVTGKLAVRLNRNGTHPDNRSAHIDKLFICIPNRADFRRINRRLVLRVEENHQWATVKKVFPRDAISGLVLQKKVRNLIANV